MEDISCLKYESCEAGTGEGGVLYAPWLPLECSVMAFPPFPSLSLLSPLLPLPAGVRGTGRRRLQWTIPRGKQTGGGVLFSALLFPPSLGTTVSRGLVLLHMFTLGLKVASRGRRMAYASNVDALMCPFDCLRPAFFHCLGLERRPRKAACVLELSFT